MAAYTVKIKFHGEVKAYTVRANHILDAEMMVVSANGGVVLTSERAI